MTVRKILPLNCAGRTLSRTRVAILLANMKVDVAAATARAPWTTSRPGVIAFTFTA